MSQAIEEALATFDPADVIGSVEELLADAQTEADRARQQELRLTGSEREPLLRVVGLLAAAIIAAYASAEGARAFSRAELAEELLDAATVAKQERAQDPANHPVPPALYNRLHQAFLELHRRNGRYCRLSNQQDLLELIKGAALLAGEIACVIDEARERDASR